MQATMPAASPTPAPIYVIVATNGAGANLRTGPSTAGPVIATLAEGTPVDTLGEPVLIEGRSWRRIRGEGLEGWVVSVVVRQR
jgi:SH3-like domain-containing protein